jgi:NAD(P)-dependent dehydrogenase (short-subunit alcohol dehydrogenase family)
MQPIRTALVTGASKGIGYAIALRLAREGFHVVATARHAPQLAELVSRIQTGGGAASYFAADLRDEPAAAALVEFAVNRTGRLDLLVSNAGATKRAEFDQLTDADFLDGFALKYFGAVRLTRAAWPQLTAHQGSIIYISGIGGKTPGRQFTIGGSVNAALLSFTKAIAETGLRDGVQINCICPGTIRTARFEQRLEADAQAAGTSKEIIATRFVTEQRIRRIGEPDDVAALVAFLTGPEGTLMHGALIDIDAGATKAL